MSDSAVLSMRNGLEFFQSGIFVANADDASELHAAPKEFNVKCDAAHLFTTLPAPAYQLSLLIPHSSAATTAPHSRSRACRLAPGRNGWSALLLLLSWATRGRCAALHPSLALLNAYYFLHSSARYLMNALVSSSRISTPTSQRKFLAFARDFTCVITKISLTPASSCGMCSTLAFRAKAGI